MRLASAWSVVFLIAIGASFFAKAGDMFSRVWLGTFYVSGLVRAGDLAPHAVLLLVRRWTREGRLTRRTVIVGGGDPGARRDRGTARAERLRRRDHRRVRRPRRRPQRADCAGEPKLGKVDDIVEFARRTRVDLVIFALPISAEGRILQMLKKLWVLPVDIRLSAHTNKLRFRPRSYSYIGKVPTLDVFDRPIADWDVVMKWLFDKIVGGAAADLPRCRCMALVALAIKLDSPGPVLFRQKRFGFNNERIDVFKFRSLHVDMADPTATKVVTKDDPRVTRVGRFIRKTSLDELPQLFNVVFKGNLSLVGPRPHAVNAKAEASSSTRRSTAISPATASSPASPAGRRSTAGAARSTRTRRSRSASSTTSITSRTGRCCSTSTSWRARRSRCSRPRMPIDHRTRHRRLRRRGRCQRAARRRCASACC